MRWSGKCLALAMLGLLLAPTALAKASDDAPSFRVVASNAVADLFDVHGDRLVWFQGSATRFDLVLQDLTAPDMQVLTSVIAQGSLPLRVQDVGFDGRWVVWCDDRFGNLEVFAFDTSAGSLVRVTEAGPDDAEATVDAGRVAWSRSNQIWIHDLENGTSWQVAGTGQASEPALTGQTIAWVRLAEGERYLAASTFPGGEPQTVARVQGSFIHSLQAADGLLAWEAWILRDPANPGRGFNSTVVQVKVDVGPVQNVSSVPALDSHGTSLGLAVGEGRVAWFDPAAQTTQVWLPSEAGNGVGTIGYQGTAMALSSKYLVVSQITSEGGTLAARPWSADDKRESWFVPAPGLVAVLLAGLLALAAFPRRR